MSRRPWRRSGLWRWLPALALMALIFILSSVSGLRVSEDPEVDRPARILAHLGVYALLGGSVVYAIGPGRRAPLAAAAAFLLTLLYGLSDEVHQSLVPGRTGRVDDLVVDALGALVGVVAGTVLLPRLGRGRPPDVGEPSP